MYDGKKIYAIVSGAIAIILVIAVAFTVLSGQKGEAAPTKKQATVQSAEPVKKSNTTVKAVVRTPDMNRVVQSVTVKK